VGDSTVQTTTAGQLGWGTAIAHYFDTTKIRVVNRALGGRSSRTFQTEGHWERALAEIRTGDYVLIQFGHNDAGSLDTGGLAARFRSWRRHEGRRHRRHGAPRWCAVSGGTCAGTLPTRGRGRDADSLLSRAAEQLKAGA